MVPRLPTISLEPQGTGFLPSQPQLLLYKGRYSSGLKKKVGIFFFFKKRANPADVQYTEGGIYTQLWRCLPGSQEVPPRSLVAAVRDSGAPRAGAGEGCGTAVLRSVQEALAGFFPPAGRAPLVPVLDAVYLTALFGFTTDFSAKGGRGKKTKTNIYTLVAELRSQI